MNKVCFWTQTYGNDRKELFEFHSFDKFDIDLRNNFHSIFTFHNCSDDYFEEVSNCDYLNSIVSKELIRFNGISYTECCKNIIEYLKEQGFEYLIFSQDDSFFQFSQYNKPYNFNIEDIVNIFESNTLEMLNLEWSNNYLKKDDYYELNFFKIYKTTSKDFENFGAYSFDDNAFFSKIDFISENLFDEQYFSKGDIWNAEQYLNEKWRKKEYPRFILNFGLYKRYNLLGRNTNPEYRNELNKIFKNE
jgi:hypothetical protein